MMLTFQSRLAESVRAAARAAFDADPGPVAFQYPPSIDLGDLAVTAPFDLARTLRRKPREIAERLARELAGAPGVRRAEAAGGGYVNVFLDRGAFARQLHDHFRRPSPAPAVPGRVIVEHTSINPNKAAHVGHVRNATLGDTFVRVLRHRGREVGVQNYIDDTGVQVADVVVGFMHLERKSRPEVERLAAAERFDYLCWDLYARVGDFYAADPANRTLQAATFHAIERGDSEEARMAALVAAHDRGLPPAHDGAPGHPLRPAGPRERHPPPPLLGPRLRAAQGQRRDPPRDRGQERRVLGPGHGAGGRRADEDKIIVRSDGTVTYTGKDIAYQLWKLGLLDRDFRYRRHRTYPDGHVLWSTTSGEGEGGAPAFGHARAVYNVIDVGQSYPQRVVKAGVAALGHAEAAERSRHLGYEKVVLSPATARDLGYAVSEDETAVKVSGRKGLGVKADDLMDALVAKARAEVDARDPAREAAAREATATAIATGALRYFLLKYGRTKIITFDMDEALAFTGETGPYIQNGRGARAQHLRQARGRGPRAWTPWWRGAAGRTSTGCSRARRATRSGRCCCSWPAARRWPSRR